MKCPLKLPNKQVNALCKHGTLKGYLHVQWLFSGWGLITVADRANTGAEHGLGDTVVVDRRWEDVVLVIAVICVEKYLLRYPLNPAELARPHALGSVGCRSLRADVWSLRLVSSISNR